MENNNILIIAKIMLPYADCFGGCQRMYYLANSLCEKGCNVTMVSEKTGRKNKALKNMETKYKMRWVESKPYGNMWILRTNLMKRLSKELFNELDEYFAFQHYLWCCDSIKEIFKIIKEERIGTVIISAPYFSVFTLVGKIKKHFKDVNVILDYRDPWTLWNNKQGFSKWLESVCIKRCDKVVCASEEIRDDMVRIFAGKSGKFEAVCNGYYENAWKDVDTDRERNSDMIFEFVGMFWLYDSEKNCRNPHRLINSFLKICGDRNVELRFIGRPDITNDMRDIEEKSGGKIKFYRRVSAKESMEKMVEGDVLININDTKDDVNNYALGAKTYDYLRSGRVIWGMAGKKGALERFIKNNGVGVFCENREDEIERMLIRLYEKWKKNNFIERKNKNTDWHIYSREYQNEKYFQIIRELDARRRKA